MEQQSYTKDCWNGPCDCPEHQPKEPKLKQSTDEMLSKLRSVNTCKTCAFYHQVPGLQKGYYIDYCVSHNCHLDEIPWKTVCDRWVGY